MLSSVLFLLVGCQPTEEPSEALVATQALSDRSVEMLTTKNWDLMDELVAADYVRHDPSAPDPITSRDALRGYLTDFLETAYPDWQVTVEEVIVTENRTATRWRFMGTNTGPRGDLPATGRSVDITGLSLTHFENGMVVEEWVQGDGVAVLEQLGFSIIPPEEAGEESER
jgi:steroid delta-isomerase-like uncharacterized protein